MNERPTPGLNSHVESPGLLAGVSGRLRRLALGTVAVGLNQVINLAAQILLVPILLRIWGVELYGEWLTLSAAMAFLAVLDFGMQMYVVNLLHQHYVQGRLQDYTRTLHSALLLSASLAVGSLLILGLVLSVAPLEQWFNLHLTSHTMALWTALFLGAQMLATTFQGLIGGVYRTVGQFPRGVMVVNIQRIVTIGATVALLLQGSGLAIVALGQLLPVLGSLAFIWWDVRRRYPEVPLGFRQGETAQMAAFIGPSMLFFLITLSQILALQGSVLILGTGLGAGVLATFVTQRTLTNIIRQTIAAINNALTPEVSTLASEGRFAALRTVHLLTVKVATLLALCAAAWLHVAGQEVVKLWTHGRITYEARLMDILLLFLVTQTPWMTSSVLLSATNQHRRLTVAYAASGVLGLGLGWLLSLRSGAIGMVSGLWAADLLICCLWVPLLACRSTQQSVRAYAFEIGARAIPVSAVLLAVNYWLTVSLKPAVGDATWAVISAIATGIVGATAGYVLWLSPSERQRIRVSLKLAAGPTQGEATR